MKKLSIFYTTALIICLMTGSAIAQISYSKDFLEVGNPGGWSDSTKTFEESWTLSPGDTVDVDIWVTDVPEPSLLSAGFFIFNDSPLVNITSVTAYDDENDGPWEVPSSVVEVYEPEQGIFGWFVVVSSLACVEADTDGDMILGKVTLECENIGDAEITILPIADFATLGGCGGTIYDSQITPNTITIHQGVDAIDLDIARFVATKSVRLRRVKAVALVLTVKNNGTSQADKPAHIIGIQNGVEVYNETLAVSAPTGKKSTQKWTFPSYTPVDPGNIEWTATIDDDDLDVDEETVTTRVVP